MATLLAVCLAATWAATGCERGAAGAADEWVELRDPQAPDTALAPLDPAAFPYRRAYRFDEDWFSGLLHVWAALLQPYMGKPDLRYLEVGVWQGRSFLWMVDHVLTHPGSHATGVDIVLTDALAHNIELSGAAERIEMRIGASQIELRTLEPASFDIIYIDGSHAAPDVLEDIVLAWRLLKAGGLMILDDYGFDGAHDAQGAPLPEALRPRVAIDAFIAANRSFVEVVHKGYRVALRRRSGLCARGAWQCSTLGPYSYDWRLQQLYRGAEDIAIDDAERGILEALLRGQQPDALTLRVARALYESEGFAALDARLRLGLR